ncbi:hypothetical protein [Bathymodiolus thermophilus thioautotrophic gill symbiont]|uniref:Type IV pilus biogenesis protein PilP n=1 Tax=Bathymodiolus thermophilus thioautotrophic gill symbiont TaxID=2360 RepID=A0A1J5UNF1_9GAMM|nr:hypothetical protein [Bathymodiolus thermophilus thioautotrophic gill symbiont]OIR25751.1 hypothetical protein BGC33_15365 [Bathymodiolus thermophilus thioautotrophic gill symbiont]CAB5495710.1 hypothetical protein THERMOS_348 [Bathymodiolus thermophilus thioautotrophic gill symbiont]
MIKNSIMLMIMLSTAYIADAQTAIKAQEARLDNLNYLAYKVKALKFEAELAKLRKQCQNNDGCLNDTDNPLIAAPIVAKKVQNNVKQVINKEVNINALSIAGIVNKRVAFRGVSGFFQVGDVLDNGIKIKVITDSSVTLASAINDNIQKTITINWTMK